MFTKSETDKVIIEHILPQTPTTYYWRNQFRAYNCDEVKTLSMTLGNMLPLSQKINSSLQNVGFKEKKESGNGGRRGYENGSHSEIEVSHECEWNDSTIYERTIHLLNFLETRWDCKFRKNQKEELSHISFIHESRRIPIKLIEKEFSDDKFVDYTKRISGSRFEEMARRNIKFWKHFVEYCNNMRRVTIVAENPSTNYWYNINVEGKGFDFRVEIKDAKYVSLVIYTYNLEAFNSLHEKKHGIEHIFNDKLDWNSNSIDSSTKQIIYQKQVDIFNEKNESEIFDWIIGNYDKLLLALKENNFIRDIKPSSSNLALNDINCINTDRDFVYLNFWMHFVNYCKNKHRETIVISKPLNRNYYDIAVGGQSYHLNVKTSLSNDVEMNIYIYDNGVFEAMKAKKNSIEKSFTDKLNWNVSHDGSHCKRINYKRKTNKIDKKNENEIFNWIVLTYDRLVFALKESNFIKGTKYSAIKSDVNQKNYMFWNNFTKYYNSLDKEKLTNKRDSFDNWIYFSVYGKGFHLEYTSTSYNSIDLVIVTKNIEGFKKVLAVKENIEIGFEHEFDWFSTSSNTNNRIIYTIRYNYLGDNDDKILFELMVDNLNKLYYVLKENRLIHI